MATPPLLEVQHLSVEFGRDQRVVRAVDDLSFAVAPAETLAIVGESGSGKSVTALAILRLIERDGGRITRGSIRLTPRDGRTIDLLQTDERLMQRIRGHRVGMVFQEPMTSLNPVITLGEQLAETLRLHKGLDHRAASAEARSLLDKVRIPDAKRRLEQYPHELSGGMRQRVMIAMALACDPELLIADEPTTALDVTVQAQILDLILLMQDQLRMAVVFITHDMGIVARMADRVVVMRNGRKVEENGVHELFAAPGEDYTRSLLAAVPRLGQGAVGRSPEPLDKAPVLELAGLTKRFAVRKGIFRKTLGEIHAVDDVSLTLARGETLGIVGESGCGKSTTGRALMRLVEPTSGRIFLCGREITRLPPREMRRARRDIQAIFQDPYASLNPRLTVGTSITEPLRIHEPKLSAKALHDRAAALLLRVGLHPDHLGRYPHQFSGGQRQRIAIARALSLEPKVIVADEPVSALDVSIQAQVVELLRELQRELGIAILFISHDIAVVEKMSHRVAVMYAGQIVETGPTEDVLHRPRHDYTRKLLASVPLADPARSRPRQHRLEPEELSTSMRPADWQRPSSRLLEVDPGHFVRSAC